MTTPTGQISLNDVNVELGLAGTTLISMNQTNVRTLAGVPSGQISMQNLQGKSNRVALSYVYSANTANASLNLSAISGYSAGKSDITVTINAGVYIYSTSTGTPALSLTGGTTGDTLTIVNNGYIMGMGGQGSQNGSDYGVGASGGNALNLGIGISSCTINNTNASAYIGGGGGGGAGSYYTSTPTTTYFGGGGGAGGGTGGKYVESTALNLSGGAGGGIGSSGGNGTSGTTGGGKTPITYQYSSGGGGRIFAGTGGNGSNNAIAYGGGSGGGGHGCNYNGNITQGGNGGSANSSGGNASYSGTLQHGGGGGGGWGASGGTALAFSAWTVASAGSGGKAVNTNGKSVTWTSGDTARVYGAVS